MIDIMLKGPAAAWEHGQLWSLTTGELAAFLWGEGIS
jgi:hypothetical protein